MISTRRRKSSNTKHPHAPPPPTSTTTTNTLKNGTQYCMSLSHNFETIINSIDQMDGYVHFVTNEKLIIETFDNVFVTIDFKLFFTVWIEKEELIPIVHQTSLPSIIFQNHPLFNNNLAPPPPPQNPNEDIIDIVVDFEDVSEIVIKTNCHQRSKVLKIFDSIPPSDNDVINLILDECIEELDNNISLIFI